MLLFLSCKQYKNNKISRYNFTNKDTIEANGYVLSFENTDSFPETDIYGDLKLRKLLTDTIYNSHQQAQRIQAYLLDKNRKYFFEKDSSVNLILSNGELLKFPYWDSVNFEGFNFVHYFKEINYYLLSVQWEEGNCWMLVNRNNGFKTYLIGLPYISEDKKHIVSINSDLEAGFSYNGIQFFSILKDSLRKDFTVETSFGPTDVKWVSNNQFLIKREHFNSNATDNNYYSYDFKKVSIFKK